MAGSLGGAALAAAGVAGFAAVVIWFGILAPQDHKTVTQPAANLQAAAPVRPAEQGPAPEQRPPVGAPTTSPAADSSAVPSFDIVRVEPSGEAVIAGRSTPGATIDLLRSGEPFARVMADTSGLFAIVPNALPPGSHDLTLQSISPDGTRTRSRQSVTVVIAPGRNVAPLVALSAPDQPTVVLSKPEEPDQGAVASAGNAASPNGAAAVPSGAEPGARAQVKVTAVETQDNGRLFVSGRASPGATVRLYLNDSFVAPGASGSDGKFSFTIGRGLKQGDYRVRLDDVDPVSGDVKSRAEVDFVVPPQALAAAPVPDAEAAGVAGSTEGRRNLAAGPETKPGGASVHIPEIVTTTVAPGDNLWQISRRTYGHGLRYTVIYGANQKQIRNPDRIYPGQIFVLPAQTRPDATPAAPNP